MDQYPQMGPGFNYNNPYPQQNFSYDQYDFSDIKKRLKNTKVRTIWSMVLSIVGLLAFIWILAVGFATTNPLLLFPILLVFPSLIASFIINVVNGAIMLSTDFFFKGINNIKVVWGIFTIIILGWIASLVFVIKAQKIFNEEMRRAREPQPMQQQNFTNSF